MDRLRGGRACVLGAIGIRGVRVGGSGQSETVGRWAFGNGPVLAGLFTLWGLFFGVRESVRRLRQ